MDKKGQAPIGEQKVPQPKPNNPKYIKGVATPDTKK